MKLSIIGVHYRGQIVFHILGPVKRCVFSKSPSQLHFKGNKVSALDYVKIHAPHYPRDNLLTPLCPPLGNKYEGRWIKSKLIMLGCLNSRDQESWQWVQGRCCPPGRWTYQNGEIYEFESQIGETEIGTMSFSNGDRYHGDWLQGKMHGHGKYIFKNGATYEGYFCEGKRHGLGKHIYADGRVYEGEWVDDNEAVVN